MHRGPCAALVDGSWPPDIASVLGLLSPTSGPTQSGSTPTAFTKPWRAQRTLCDGQRFHRLSLVIPHAYIADRASASSPGSSNLKVVVPQAVVRRGRGSVHDNRWREVGYRGLGTQEL